ncbi:hypothetical protein TEA_012190 [Camellia sinensis var. sinensis]|uniref:3-hydroxyisobutyryl-CoA hydrolase n=1 Tax=Camellia sinensis var. sinensis TaxID=542762 RepID=A0A4S4EVW3_CAMSN|nr:hypothetical protein TEA_012190 [Camellia sinensis var. sinensis]
MPSAMISTVLVEGKGWSRTAILNRPSVLNALNTAVARNVWDSLSLKDFGGIRHDGKCNIIQKQKTYNDLEQLVKFAYLFHVFNSIKGARLQKLYKSWEDNPDIGFVVLKNRIDVSAARAEIQFCRRGKTSYRVKNSFLVEEIFDGLPKWRETVEHGKDAMVLRAGVALLNGITMGGGAGVSIPGTFKVATDKTVFATPETLIGFHPDAGASFYLSHLPGHLGEYLALTGDKLNGVELISCGLATHYSISARLPLIEEQLGKLVTDDPSVVETSLAKYGDIVYPDRASVLHRIETLDKCFSHDTVEEIIDALESEAAKTHDDWCTSTLKKLQHCSPLSLKVSLRSIREGRFQTLDQCLVREYRMSLQGISKQISNDFCEGVRARVVDKDMAPKWNPPNLEQVSKDMVDQYFSPLSEVEPDLELPIKQREAFT